MIVLDASALVELLLNTVPGQRLAERLRSDVTLHAPHLIDLEVAQTLRRYVRLGQITQERAEVALEHLVLLDLNRYQHSPFLPRIWALKENVTAYDAAYVAGGGAGRNIRDRRSSPSTGAGSWREGRDLRMIAGLR